MYTSCKQSRSSFHGNSYLCEDLTLSHWSSMQKYACIYICILQNITTVHKCVIYMPSLLYFLSAWVKKHFTSFFVFLLLAFKIQLKGNSTYPEASLVICSLLKSLSLTHCPHLLNFLYNTDCSPSLVRVTTAPYVSKRILNAWFRTNKHILTPNICKEGVATHSLIHILFFPSKWQQSVAHMLFLILTNIWED